MNNKIKKIVFVGLVAFATITTFGQHHHCHSGFWGGVVGGVVGGVLSPRVTYVAPAPAPVVVTQPVVTTPQYSYGYYNNVYCPTYSGYYYYNNAWTWGGGFGHRPPPPMWHPRPHGGHHGPPPGGHHGGHGGHHRH